MLSRLSDSLLSLIYPQICKVCSGSVQRAADGVACGDCWNDTRIFAGHEALCSKCGAVSESRSVAPVECPNCQGHFYDKAIAVGVYEKALAAALIDLKSRPHIPGRLKQAIRSRLSEAGIDRVDRVVPVPLSKRRLHERGFNQAALIAKVCADVTDAAVDEFSVQRTVHTVMHRAAMDRAARARTVEGAFEVTRPKLINGMKILLVDDLFTSGATVSNCAKVLKEKGAASVDVFTLARAVSLFTPDR